MFDVIIILILALFFFAGLKKGFVKTAYSMLSLILSAVIVYFLKDSFVSVIAASPIGESIGSFFASGYGGEFSLHCSEAVISVVSVIILYFLVKLALRMLINVADLIARLPLISSLNKLLGGVVGIAVGALWVVVITNVGHCFPQLAPLIDASRLVKMFGILFI